MHWYSLLLETGLLLNFMYFLWMSFLSVSLLFFTILQDLRLKTRRLYCVEWTHQHNTVFTRSGLLLCNMFPWAHHSRRRKRHLDPRSFQPFLQGWLGDRPTDRPKERKGKERKNIYIAPFILRLVR